MGWDRRKARLRDLLEQALARLERGASPGACLEDLPEGVRRELEPLLEAAWALLQAGRSPVDPALRERVLRQVLEARGRPRGRLLPLRQAALALATALFLALAVGGVWRAAQASLPGHPLYALRSVEERVRLWAAPTPGQKALLHAGMARLYAGDAVEALEQGRPSLASDLAWRAALHLREAVVLAGLTPLEVPGRPPALPPAARRAPVEGLGLPDRPIALPARQALAPAEAEGPALLDALWSRLAQDFEVHRLQALGLLQRLSPADREIALRALRLTLRAYRDALARVELGLGALSP